MGGGLILLQWRLTCTLLVWRFLFLDIFVYCYWCSLFNALPIVGATCDWPAHSNTDQWHVRVFRRCKFKMPFLPFNFTNVRNTAQCNCWVFAKVYQSVLLGYFNYAHFKLLQLPAEKLFFCGTSISFLFIRSCLEFLCYVVLLKWRHITCLLLSLFRMLFV